jgi:hypothetical protein
MRKYAGYGPLKLLLFTLLALSASFDSAEAAVPQYVDSWFTNAQGAEVSCIGLQTPSETVPGDLMLAIFTVREGSPPKAGTTSIIAPSGWTLVSEGGITLSEDVTDTSGFGIKQAVYYRIATNSEPGITDAGCSKRSGNYIWQFTNTNNSVKGVRINAGIAIFHGVDPSDPIDAVSTSGGVSTNVITAPSLITTASNDLLVGVFGVAGMWATA